MYEEQKIIKPIRELLDIKYAQIIKELQSKCGHKYDNGETSIIHLIDDVDSGNPEPTYKEWDLCDICDMVWE